MMDDAFLVVLAWVDEQTSQTVVACYFVDTLVEWVNLPVMDQTYLKVDRPLLQMMEVEVNLLEVLQLRKLAVHQVEST